LFVDDEKMLVDIAQQVLERLGYDVVSRTSPIEALALFTAKPDHFDLVITDQTMPGMTGDVLARDDAPDRPSGHHLHRLCQAMTLSGRSKEGSRPAS
jgi:CheY-like chemotaxis protein